MNRVKRWNWDRERGWGFEGEDDIEVLEEGGGEDVEMSEGGFLAESFEGEEMVWEVFGQGKV